MEYYLRTTRADTVIVDLDLCLFIDRSPRSCWLVRMDRVCARGHYAACLD